MVVGSNSILQIRKTKAGGVRRERRENPSNHLLFLQDDGQHTEDKIQKLSLDHLRPAFGVLILGLVSAGIVALLEICCGRKKKSENIL